MTPDRFAGRTTIVVAMACVCLTACTSIGAKHQPTLTAEAALQVATEAEASGNSELAQSMYIQAAAREPGNSPPSSAARIELADLRERVRKLEAIAAGVDL